MILGFFFLMTIVFLFVFAIGSSIINGVLNLIFGFFQRVFGRGGQSQQSQQSRQSHQSHQSHGAGRESQARQSTTTADSRRREKIFDKSDGEYVDFEEIE